MERYLFIGLGNPGERYQHTRHNLGIWILREWVEHVRDNFHVGQWKRDETIAAEIAIVSHQTNWEVTCLFPLTFMNNSGEAVAQFLKAKALQHTHLVVLHDDVELPLGTVQWREGGSARGHKGLKSIQAALQTTEIPHLRLGVGRPDTVLALDEYVLHTFAPQEDIVIREQTTPQALAILSKHLLG